MDINKLNNRRILLGNELFNICNSGNPVSSQQLLDRLQILKKQYRGFSFNTLLSACSLKMNPSYNETLVNHYLKIANVKKEEHLIDFSLIELIFIKHVLGYLFSIKDDWKLSNIGFDIYMKSFGFFVDPTLNFIDQFGRGVIGIIGRGKTYEEKTTLRLERIKQLSSLVEETMKQKYIICEQTNFDNIKNATKVEDLTLYNDFELKLINDVLEYIKTTSPNWKLDEDDFVDNLLSHGYVISSEKQNLITNSGPNFGKNVIGAIGKDDKKNRTSLRLMRIKEIQEWINDILTKQNLRPKNQYLITEYKSQHNIVQMSKTIFLKQFEGQNNGITMGNINIQKLSGPTALSIQVPDETLYRRYLTRGIRLPIIMSMGDAHIKPTNECKQEEGVYHILGTDFIKAMDQVGNNDENVIRDLYLETFHRKDGIKSLNEFFRHKTSSTNRFITFIHDIFGNMSQNWFQNLTYTRGNEKFIESLFANIKEYEADDLINNLSWKNAACFLHELKDDPVIMKRYQKYYDQYCKTKNMRWQHADPRYARDWFSDSDLWFEGLMSYLYINKYPSKQMLTSVSKKHNTSLTESEIIDKIFDIFESTYGDFETNPETLTNKSTIPNSFLNKLINVDSKFQKHSLLYKQMKDIPKDILEEWFQSINSPFNDFIHNTSHLYNTLKQTKVHLQELKKYITGKSLILPTIPDEVHIYLLHMFTLLNDIYFVCRMIKQGGSDITFTFFGAYHTKKIRQMLLNIGYHDVYYIHHSNASSRCTDVSSINIDMNKAIEYYANMRKTSYQ